MSVREYAILYINGRLVDGGGAIAGGGTIVLRTAKHRLDGPEHTEALDSTTLDTSTTRHGLAPKLPGDAALFLNGVGGFTAPAGSGAMVPYFIAAGDAFTVPVYKQAPYVLPIVIDGTLIEDGYLVEVD